MRGTLQTLAVIFAAVGPCWFVSTAEPSQNNHDGFEDVFDGKTLGKWVNVNCAPSTFKINDGVLVTDGNPTGYLRSPKHYENFILDLEWKHINTKTVGNSGIFVWGDPLPAVGTGYTRGIEVQVLVNYPPNDWATNHGDLFSIWGAKCKPDRPHPKGYERCLPSEERCKGGGEWNHYRITANDGSIKLEVNGKEVSGVSNCVPRVGYLAFESEGAECHFRNIKIKELPSTNPQPEEIADVDKGFLSQFDGLTLKGFDGEAQSWKAGGGVLRCMGEQPLKLPKFDADVEWLLDWKGPRQFDIVVSKDSEFASAAKKMGEWQRETISVPAGQSPVIPAKKGLEMRSLFARQVAK